MPSPLLTLPFIKKRTKLMVPRGGLAPPFNKLTLLKTPAFVLNFKLCPPPLIYAWPPLVVCSAAGSPRVTELCQTLSMVFVAYGQGRIQGGRMSGIHPLTSHFQQCV